jgi:hypothetical protein
MTLNAHEARTLPLLRTALDAPELLLEEEPLPPEMLLLPGAGTEDALRIEIVNPSAWTNLRNRTRLAPAKAALIRKPTDENQQAIHERVPPGKLRKKLTRTAMLAPLTNRPENATPIQRLNPTDPTPPPNNQTYFFNLFHHLFPETN